MVPHGCFQIREYNTLCSSRLRQLLINDPGIALNQHTVAEAFTEEGSCFFRQLLNGADGIRCMVGSVMVDIPALQLGFLQKGKLQRFSKLQSLQSELRHPLRLFIALRQSVNSAAVYGKNGLYAHSLSS
ncbi:hypothetical protein D3C76_1581200 [compost metagenome]